ncbi:MAG: hypothetical protein LBI69_04815 [Puniceicoccales bacterium]|jgi:hypothetical protein|nr:hypothetical protein [Puniceicoccales bacterium]
MIGLLTRLFGNGEEDVSDSLSEMSTLKVCDIVVTVTLGLVSASLGIAIGCGAAIPAFLLPVFLIAFFLQISPLILQYVLLSDFSTSSRSVDSAAFNAIKKIDFNIKKGENIDEEVRKLTVAYVSDLFEMQRPLSHEGEIRNFLEEWLCEIILNDSIKKNTNHMGGILSGLQSNTLVDGLEEALLGTIKFMNSDNGGEFEEKFACIRDIFVSARCHFNSCGDAAAEGISHMLFEIMLLQCSSINEAYQTIIDLAITDHINDSISAYSDCFYNNSSDIVSFKREMILLFSHLNICSIPKEIVRYPQCSHTAIEKMMSDFSANEFKIDYINASSREDFRKQIMGIISKQYNIQDGPLVRPVIEIAMNLISFFSEKYMCSDNSFLHEFAQTCIGSSAHFGKMVKKMKFNEFSANVKALILEPIRNLSFFNDATCQDLLNFSAFNMGDSPDEEIAKETGICVEWVKEIREKNVESSIIVNFNEETMRKIVGTYFANEFMKIHEQKKVDKIEFQMK